MKEENFLINSVVTDKRLDIRRRATCFMTNQAEFLRGKVTRKVGKGLHCTQGPNYPFISDSILMIVVLLVEFLWEK